MSSHSSSSSNLTIETKKFADFQQWCVDNNLNSQQVIEQIIDGCLENDSTIVEFLTNGAHHPQLDQQIQNQIQKAMEPLIQRIEQLEARINSTNNHQLDTNKSDTIDENLREVEKETETDLQKIPTENITYLPRSEVWKRLKETNYVKNAGYDSFLKARGDEFVYYGIHFDREKKRFYIIN